MTDREYLDELPAGVVVSTRRKYERLVPSLVDNPGKWVLADDGLTKQKASALCSTIRRRRLKAFKDAGPAFEAERVADVDGGTFSVYTRFVRPGEPGG